MKTVMKKLRLVNRWSILPLGGVIVFAASMAIGVSMRQAPQAIGQSEYFIYLPLVLNGAGRADLFNPDPITRPSMTPEPSDVPMTEAPTESPTFPPTATGNPTPTATPSGDGKISGRLLFNREPAFEGLGIDFGPGLFLQRCVGAACETVDKTGVVGEEGLFEFKNPPSLEAGGHYSVLWKNVELDGLFGTPDYIGRWESLPIEDYAVGDQVELPDIEISNIELLFPENDIHYTLPVEYKWTARSSAPGEGYLWSLFRNCAEWDRQAPGDFYRSANLGRRNTYTVAAPPPRYEILEKYCWYVYVEDHERGTGWSFYRYKTMWLGFLELMSGWAPARQRGSVCASNCRWETS